MRTGRPLKISQGRSQLADHDAGTEQFQNEHYYYDDDDKGTDSIDNRGGSCNNSQSSTVSTGPIIGAKDEQQALALIKTNVERRHKRNSAKSMSISNRQSYQNHTYERLISGDKQETRHRRQSPRSKHNNQAILQPEAAISGTVVREQRTSAVSLLPAAWPLATSRSTSVPALVSLRPLGRQTIVMKCLIGALVVTAATLLALTSNGAVRIGAVAAAAAPGTATSPSAGAVVPQSADSQRELAGATRAELEGELEALLRQQQQQNEPQDTNSKLLSEAIISRLMLGNLSDSTGPRGETNNAPDPMAGLGEQDVSQPPSSDLSDSNSATGDVNLNQLMAPGDSASVMKLLSYLRNNNQVFDQFPVLPLSPAATAKRASQKVGNYLRQQQHPQQRQLNGYGRSTFDFGLGKRPDASVAGNILRLGDSGGHMQPVSGQFGKRPSAHRYDFGLGKRVVSVSFL